MNQMHIVATMSVKYSALVDYSLPNLILVTLLAMNGRMLTPRQQSFFPPTGRDHSLPVGFRGAGARASCICIDRSDNLDARFARTAVPTVWVGESSFQGELGARLARAAIEKSPKRAQSTVCVPMSSA